MDITGNSRYFLSIHSIQVTLLITISVWSDSVLFSGSTLQGKLCITYTLHITYTYCVKDKHSVFLIIFNDISINAYKL